MDQAIDIKDWNKLREEAKKDFTFDVICRLDSSGYINEVLYPEDF